MIVTWTSFKKGLKRQELDLAEFFANVKMIIYITKIIYLAFARNVNTIFLRVKVKFCKISWLDAVSKDRSI